MGMAIDDLNQPNSRLLHVNNAYLTYQYFQQMIKMLIHPLRLHAQEGINYAWESFVSRIQEVIQDYGAWHVFHLRQHVSWAKREGQSFTELSHCRQLSAQEMHTLSQAHSVRQMNDHHKLHKWQTRARIKPLLDKGCSSRSFFQSLHAHRRKLSISGLKLEDGSWTQTLSDLHHECLLHFLNLFSSPGNPTNQVLQARMQFIQHVSPIVKRRKLPA